MNNEELAKFHAAHNSNITKDDDLVMPVETTTEYPDIHELLDNTDPRHIYLTSDWHFFKNHYKKEHNYVNTQKILTWCRQNIKENDVFMYLGDISFRYANKEDQKESQRLLASIPGIKVLILGNHDMMLGQEYFTGCGFHYVFERLDHKNMVFTHKPIPMEIMPEDFINIHGHIHNMKTYNTTDGKRNINVYPLWYDGKPVTLDYCLNHIDKLVKDNSRSDWTQIGESADYRDIEDLDINLETSRANLKDNQFGIPEDRKYPLDSKKHVMSAIKLFGHAEESKKKALAKRIKTAADNYNIKIPENTQVYKYLPESYFIESNINKVDIPDGVENIVFDMGNVLVEGNMLPIFKSREDIPNELCQEIYDFIVQLFFYKKENCVAQFTAEQAKEYYISVAPDHLKQYADAIFESMNPAMYVYSYTYDLIKAFRSRGYNIYYLSNWDRFSYELERSFFEPLLEKFDGGLFSYECHMEKPSLSIYKLFTSKFNLEPSKCLFLDDKPENIEAAKLCGWNGIVFTNPETPLGLFKTLYSKSNINLSVNPKNKIPVLIDGVLDYIESKEIERWYVSEERNPLFADLEEKYSRTIDLAISNSISDSDFEEKYVNYVVKNIFISHRKPGCIWAGSVMVFRDGTWEWMIQNPFYLDEAGYLKDAVKSKINEWSMASMNPVIGTMKPYVLKMCNDCGGLINAKQYALATDLISDKYLVINENANLEIVDASNFSNMIIEEYEFVGDKRLLKKIEEAYYSGKIVDNTFFYTALTGKPMLSEDQIDFDSNFKKVDFIAMKEKSLTKLATMNEAFMESMNNVPMKVNIIPNNNIKNLLGNRSHITIMEDLNGFYVYNTEKNIRSASIEEQDFITEQMINSVL